MSSWPRPRFTHANVPATLALIVALGVGLTATFATAAHGMRTVFVSNSGSLGGIESITAFSVNLDGSLVPSPVLPVGDRPEGQAVTPDARFLYVATSVTAGVRGYAIGAGGALTEVPGSPFASGGTNTTGVAVTPAGNRLLATNRGPGDGSVAAYDINQATGALTPVAGSPFAVAGIEDPNGIAIAPGGGRAFVTGDAAGGTFAPRVAVLDINQATGVLSQVAGSPFASGGSAEFATVVSPDGARLFVGNASLATPTISVLDINQATGALAPVAGSPFAAAGRAPIGLALSPDGTRLFSAERLVPATAITDGVAVYDIANNGALTTVAGSPFTSGGGRTEAVATTPDGERVYGPANANPGMVEGFSIGAAGALTPLTGSPYPTGDKFAGFLSAAMTPSQTPLPSFTVTPAGLGQASSFDASATTVPGGRATRFDWDFGDSTTLPDGGPTPQHTYTAPGTYTVDVTVTNDCSDAASFVGDTVFTGQTAHCNGSPQATTTKTLIFVSSPPADADAAPPAPGVIADTSAPSAPGVVGDTSAPSARLSGRRRQKITRQKGSIYVDVRSSELAIATAKASVSVPGASRTLRFRQVRDALLPNKRKRLRLRLSKRSFRVLRRSLRKRKRTLTATVTLTLEDAARNTSSAKRRIKLTR